MALGFRAAGTASSGTGTLLNVGMPAGTQPSDMVFAAVTVKPFSATITATQGWQLVSAHQAGTTASGLDTGSPRIAVYRKLGGGTLDFTITGANVTTAQTFGYTKASTESWPELLVATAEDNTNGANGSATSSTNFLAVSGNWILAFVGINSDVGGFSAETITATGLTMGTFTTRGTTANANGDDNGLRVHDRAVTSGTQSAGAAHTYTNASSTSMAVIFVRLYVTTGMLAVIPAANNFATTDSRYQITLNSLTGYDEWQVTRESITGSYEEEIVRGGARQDALAASEVINDYEFHWGQKASPTAETLRYRLDLWINNELYDSVYSSNIIPINDRAADSAYTGVSSTPTVYLKNVSLPGVNRCISVEDFRSHNRSGRLVGEYNILGQKYPVIITDVMGAKTGEFSFLIYNNPTWINGNSTIASLNEVELLFDNGEPLYFSTTYPYLSGILDFYFVVESYSIERLSRVVYISDSTGTDPIWKCTVQWKEIMRPGTLAVGAASLTWATVASAYANWQAVKDGNNDWLDVLQDG